MIRQGRLNYVLLMLCLLLTVLLMYSESILCMSIELDSARWRYYSVCFVQADLAQNRYFEDEAFIGYLKYLKYWQRPEYIKYIM